MYLYRVIDRDGNLVDVLLVRSVTVLRPKRSSGPRVRSLSVSLNALRPMDMTPTPEPLKLSWGRRCVIAPTATWIITWSRTIEASSNARGRWADSKVSSRPDAFVGCMTKCGTSCVHAHGARR